MTDQVPSTSLRDRDTLVSVVRAQIARAKRPPAETEFDEQEYLELNPDVAEAVRSGIFASGKAHWDLHGQREGRRNTRPLTEMIGHLQASAVEAAALADSIGQPTPEVHTMRGRVGVVLMRYASRLLWWYTYGLRRFAVSLTAVRAKEVAVLKRLADIQIRHDAELKTATETALQAVESQSSVKHIELRCAELAAAQVHLQSQLLQPSSGTDVLQSDARADLAELKGQFADLKTIVTALQVSVARREELENSEALVRRLDALEQRLEAYDDNHERVASAVKTCETVAGHANGVAQNALSLTAETGRVLHRVRADLAIQQRRLSDFLEEARKRLPQPFSADQLSSMADVPVDGLDDAYARFEDAFRGSRDEIKQRQQVYIPTLREHGIGSADMPLLDVGCGRGEWLEVLRQEGMVARGVDSNAVMVQRCRDLNLDVTLADVLQFLQGLPDASLGGLTGFHLIEHLPFPVVMRMVDQALRLLKPGGMLLFETPNPENFCVGASNFYKDPTHLRPLPADMMQFFVEARGFCHVEIRYLHPYPQWAVLPADGDRVAQRFNEHFYGPQDYGIVAWRP